MSRVRRFRRLFRLADGRSRVKEDVEVELRFHLEMRTDELIAQGMPLREAREHALREFGSWDRYESDCLAIGRQHQREIRVMELLDSIWSDVRYGWRSLRRAPGFTTVAIITLALGIGATTAIFSVVSAVLLRPLPYNAPERIVHLGEQTRAAARSGERGSTTSYDNFDDWRRVARSFEAIGIYDGWSPTLTGNGQPERILASDVTAGVFDVFRIAPVLGRPIFAADNVPNAPPVVLISYALWRQRYGGDPSVLGRSIVLNGRPMPIVGVLPPGFKGPKELDGEIWGNYVPDARDGRGARSKDVVARLKAGVTVAQAQAEMTAAAARLEKEYPRENDQMTVVVDPLLELFVGNVRPMLVLLMGASGLVLLIACANLTNLLIARGLARGREFAVRMALGAGATRTVRQLLTESLLLAAIGGAAGVALAFWATKALVALGPGAIAERGGGSLTLDGRVLAFTAITIIAAGLLFGLLPALRSARADLQTSLKDGTHGTSGTGIRARSMLTIAQLGLALMLLVGSGLLLKSFARVQRVEPGIRGDHLLTFSLNLSSAKYPDRRQYRTFYDQISERIRAVPGVTSTAVTSLVPFSGGFDRIAVEIEGEPTLVGANMPEADRYIVSGAYFSAMGIPLKRGRAFEATDGFDAPPVAVVDELFARRIFHGRDPIGRRMKLPGRDSLATIVGVAGHVRTYGLEVPSGGQIYMSNVQYPWRWMNVVVRTAGDPLALAPQMKSLVLSLDANQPIFDVSTMDRAMAALLQGRRFTLSLLGAFALVAIVMAAVGLYGVIAYSVTQRRQEIGIRMALGAQMRDIVRLVVRHGFGLAVAGIIVGVTGALVGGRLVAGLLFGVSAHDPIVLGGVSVLLLGVSLLASYLPARRAAEFQPTEVLRGA